MRFRSDAYVTQPDGSKAWYSEPLHMLAKIEKGRIVTKEGEPRATVYTNAEPTSLCWAPAQVSYQGVTLKGFVTDDGAGNIVFKEGAPPPPLLTTPTGERLLAI